MFVHVFYSMAYLCGVDHIQMCPICGHLGTFLAFWVAICQTPVLGFDQEQERKKDRMNAYYMIQEAPYNAKSVESKRFESFEAAAAVARLVLADFVVQYDNDEPKSVYMLEDDVWL